MSHARSFFVLIVEEPIKQERDYQEHRNGDDDVYLAAFQFEFVAHIICWFLVCYLSSRSLSDAGNAM